MSKTIENLKEAFAGESMARNKYTFFAKVARKEGYHYIANLFEETAINEMRHANDHFKLLGGIGDTAANLKLHASVVNVHFLQWSHLCLSVAQAFGGFYESDDSLSALWIAACA